jgi:translation initiation factor 3 subunit A
MRGLIYFIPNSSLGLASDVSPELKTLYNFIEVDFHPLTMVQNLQTSFNLIKMKANYAKYLPQLERLMVLRLLTQLSTVYKTVHLSTFAQLTSMFDSGNE